MCARCNRKKGNQLDWNGLTGGSIKQEQNGDKWITGDFERLKENEIGQTVYLKNGKKNRYGELGVISEFTVNPHVNELQFMIEGNNKSMYSLKRAFIKF